MCFMIIKKKSVLIFQLVMVHYRAAVFKLLGEKFGAIICFGGRGSSHSNVPLIDNPDFPHYRVRDCFPFANKTALAFQDVITPLFKFTPRVVITEFSLGILTNWLFFLLKPFFKYKLILWCHGYNTKVGFNPEKRFLDKIRVWCMNNADAVLLYSTNDQKLIKPYLKISDKIFVAQNTLDTKRLIRIRETLEQIGKEEIKEKIGLKEKCNLIFVGKLLEEKELDRLIDVFRIVSQQIKSIGLYIIGEGHMWDKLKKMSEGLRVVFMRSVIDELQLGEFLFASDLMVVPGYVGLGVVHSFCFDTPVVSQASGVYGPFHSPEIEYVIDGKTGFLVEYGNNNEMADRILNYLCNMGLQREMKEEIRSIVENKCSVDKMIEGFGEAIGYVDKG